MDADVGTDRTSRLTRFQRSRQLPCERRAAGPAHRQSGSVWEATEKWTLGSVWSSKQSLRNSD